MCKIHLRIRKLVIYTIVIDRCSSIFSTLSTIASGTTFQEVYIQQCVGYALTLLHLSPEETSAVPPLPCSVTWPATFISQAKTKLLNPNTHLSAISH